MRLDSLQERTDAQRRVSLLVLQGLSCTASPTGDSVGGVEPNVDPTKEWRAVCSSHPTGWGVRRHVHSRHVRPCVSHHRIKSLPFASFSVELHYPRAQNRPSPRDRPSVDAVMQSDQALAHSCLRGPSMLDRQDDAANFRRQTTRTSNRFPTASSACSIWSIREACRMSSTRSTCGRCQWRRRPSSALLTCCSNIAL